MSKNLIAFENIRLTDIATVGGKNASLGEMISQLSHMGIAVPTGFAVTVCAYQQFLEENQLNTKIIQELEKIKADNISSLRKASNGIQKMILKARFSKTFRSEIEAAYKNLLKKLKNKKVSFAVRSSATAEDLNAASFAGQQDTYLNIYGLEQILLAIKKVYASLFTMRAISYRMARHFKHEEVAISVGIQQMVRSDLAASGVIFTLDTESGFEDVILITGAYGLGELLVKGEAIPDEFYVYKPALKKNKDAILRRKLGVKTKKLKFANRKTGLQKISLHKKMQQGFCINDQEVLQLANFALLIEKHYGKPMDIEWAKDGLDGKIYIVQARPETVKSQQKSNQIQNYQLLEKGKLLTQGSSIGSKISSGKACILQHVKDMAKFKAGDILVADMTDPDWEPIMKQAAGIVTNRGGRTCHAAIIARELGVPAVVGCSDATKKIADKSEITIDCAKSDIGSVYQGKLRYETASHVIDQMPAIPVKLCLNVGQPEKAFALRQLPNAGVGLARLEFIISQAIGIHPKACLDYPKLKNPLKLQIQNRTAAYPNPREYYIEKLKEGIVTIAAAFFPKMVIFRFSDFKSNEYANLLGGNLFEPKEENPMLGFRGASRYISPQFKDCFMLECEAMLRVRNAMGLTNAHVMVPFVRTLKEAEQVQQLLKTSGLKKKSSDLKVMMMCELPSNVLLAEEFLKYFDGFSIGSNDLTQLTLGIDRDSNLVASQFDERDLAVKNLIAKAIQICRQQDKYIGICGQAPSDYPEFSSWLISQGIEAISLNPDSIIKTWLQLADELKLNEITKNNWLIQSSFYPGL